MYMYMLCTLLMYHLSHHYAPPPHHCRHPLLGSRLLALGSQVRSAHYSEILFLPHADFEAVATMYPQLNVHMLAIQRDLQRAKDAVQACKVVVDLRSCPAVCIRS